MTYKISQIPTHDSAPLTTAKMELERADGVSLWSTLAEMLAAANSGLTSTGSWTPSLLFGGGSTGITYAHNEGAWIKIGGLTFASCKIILTSKGSSTGVATIASLPFTPIVDAVVPCKFDGITSPTGTIPQVDTNGIQIRIRAYSSTAGTTSTITDTNFTNTASLLFNYAYSSTP